MNIPEKAIDQMNAAAKEMQAKVLALSITDDSSEATASAMLQEVGKGQKIVHFFCDPFCDERHRAWKQAIEQRNQFLSPWVTADEHLRKIIKSRMEEKRAAMREAQTKARQLAESPENMPVSEQAEAIAAIMTAPKQMGNDLVSSRTVWKWRLVNQTLVPDEYKKLDEAKIGAAVRKHGSSLTIPGIEIFEDVQVIRK